MKILTKHYGTTIEKDNKYLVYLLDDLGLPLSCSDVVGDKNRLLAEKELIENNEIESVELMPLKEFIKENNLSIVPDGNPLVLVFYLDSELMKMPEIIQPFTETINITLAQKDANAIALFIPTNDVERIECINPQIIDANTQIKVDKLISDITTKFDIGVTEGDLEITKSKEIE